MTRPIALSRSEPGAPASAAYRPLAEGTLNLFRAAEGAGVARLVIVSSCNSREHRDEYEVTFSLMLSYDDARMHSSAGVRGSTTREVLLQWAR